MRKLVLFLVVLLSLNFSPATSYSQSTAGFEVEVTELERRNRHLAEDLSRTQADLAKLQKDHKELSDKLDKYEPLLQDWQFYFQVLGSTGIAALVGAILTFAWLKFRTIPAAISDIVNQLPTMAQKECEAKIEQFFTDRRNDFYGLLRNYDLDQEVKKKHRIILLTHREGDDCYHHGVLKKHGFHVCPYTKIESLAEAIGTAEVSATDIVVINNEGEHWSSEEVKHFIERNANCCFYIGKKPIFLDGEHSYRFAAANFRTQFIGNLMNILRYRTN